MKKYDGRMLWGALLAVAALSVAAWREGASGAGYALMMLAMFLIFALSSGARKQREPAGVAAALSPGEVPSVRLDDVAANEEAMESLRDILSFIRSPEKYAAFGARVPRGVLLYGMPGTGKTLMARALAGEAGVPFFAVNGAEFVEMYVGVGASRVRSLFRRARKAGRAVIFFDEIDAIGKKRDNRSDEREQTLNALLCEMSGFQESDGVVVLAATNRVDTLDDALLRAGRFDRQIEVPLPAAQERLRILQVHARGKPLAPDVDLEALARQTTLFSGAKLECVLNEAAILAAKRDAAAITAGDVERAVDRTLFGMEKSGLAQLERERRATAAHEAGHAVLTAALLPQSEIRKVSIIPTGRGAAGYSMAIPPEKPFYDRQELLGHIAVALGGREAEALLMGAEHVSTGAANDIEKAAALAGRMVCEWGMLPGSDEVYLFSQSQRDQAAQQWLSRGRLLAVETLRRYQGARESPTELLLRRETVTGEDVAACLREADA